MSIKRGDKLRCIDIQGVLVDSIKVGEIYTVEDIFEYEKPPHKKLFVLEEFERIFFNEDHFEELQ